MAGANGTARRPADAEGAESAPPTSEVMIGGGAFGLGTVDGRLRALGSRRDAWPFRRLADWSYDLVDLDPAAGGSLDVLVNGCLANKAQILPRSRPRPGRDPDSPEAARAAALSAEVADLNAYALDRLDRPMHEVGAKLVRGALKHGASLGEVVWGRVPRGRFAGKVVPVRIKPKARRDWQFAVDDFLNVGGYFGRTAAGDTLLFPAERFVAHTFGGDDSDPRGVSAYDRAMEAWNFRSRVPEEYFKFIERFAQPTPDLELPPGSNQPVRGANGQMVSPEEQAHRAMANYRSGHYMVRPNGSKLGLSEPKSEGHVFNMASDWSRREIILAILLQARATMEAQNGSKADSETAERILDTLILFLRRWHSRVVEWQVLYRITLWNYGPDVADEHTPQYDLGAVGQQDRAAMYTALAALGLRLVPGQWPEVYADNALPPASIADVEAYIATTTVVAAPPALPAPEPAPADAEDE